MDLDLLDIAANDWHGTIKLELSLSHNRQPQGDNNRVSYFNKKNMVFRFLVKNYPHTPLNTE